MFYYLFKVKTNKPHIIPEYYILNNRYIGYIGFDSGGPMNSLRPKLEYLAKIKNEYKLIAKGEVSNDVELHKLNCESERLDLDRSNGIINRYKLSLYDDGRWYKEYYPFKGSSKTFLKSTDDSMIILDDGEIITKEEFKVRRKTLK